ncbi:MAG: hypothetical protein L3J29_04880 [Cyclobacteriaceae bacterium]|nr:hypothetical protein [Cyclobacteriaceae bacterium]
MPNTANELLKKVKDSIQLRDVDSETYRSTFKSPKSFITATILGKQEFIPISLLCTNHNRYQTLLDLYEVFGEPESDEKLNLRLKGFYKEHNLEWPKTENYAITYYIRPAAPAPISPFFNGSVIEKLSNYAGTRYKASDAFLKDLGNTYADEVVDKTNTWVDSLTLPHGYMIEPERYWQVAGRFKSFTWAKIYKEEFKDQKIFFSVGVDVQNKKLVIKLDGLRSGTHKLSNFDIRDFDYFTQNNELEISYDLEKIQLLNLETITFITNRFIDLNKTTYEQAINLIWNNNADTYNFDNLLLKVTPQYSSEKDPSFDNIIDKDIANLIIEYEKFILSHSGKGSLGDSVQMVTEGSLNLIKSFETDGKPKTVLYKATTGGSNAKFEMSRTEIEYLGDNLHTFLYHIIEYNINNNCGKLIIRKGSPTKYAELKSINYEVQIN